VREDGRLVLWTQPAGEFSGGQFDPLVGNLVAEYPLTPRALRQTAFQRWCGGDTLTAESAGGGLLAHSVLHYDEVDPGMDCQLSLPSGDVQATGGAVWLVSGQDRTPHMLAGVAPSHLLAAAGSLLAAVPYDLPSPVDQPPAVARTVGLWDVACASRRAIVTVGGTIVDMDLDGQVLALLVRSPQGAERIIRYDTNGLKLGSTPLAARSVRRISGAGVIAYAAGNRLVEMSARRAPRARCGTDPRGPARHGRRRAGLLDARPPPGALDAGLGPHRVEPLQSHHVIQRLDRAAAR